MGLKNVWDFFYIKTLFKDDSKLCYKIYNKMI